MPAATKTKVSRTHPRESSFVSILSGWAEQGVQSFFATQRILLDLAMRQNANILHALRQQLTDPHHSAAALLNEVAGESLSNFIDGQKVMLVLGKEQHEILMNGIQQRVGNWPAVQATTNLLRRSVETFIDMQEELLKVAGKEAHAWVQAAKAGKPYAAASLLGLAREGMEQLMRAQKHFLDVIAEETAKATGGKKTNGGRKIKPTELSEMAQQATESFIEAQKKLVDIAGKQINTNVKTAGKSLELLRPFPFPPLAELTREAVKSYVEAQKALMDVMVKPVGQRKHPAKPAQRTKKLAARKAMAAAVA